ncbi:hypothetical protein [Serratia inhibens]
MDNKLSKPVAWKIHGHDYYYLEMREEEVFAAARIGRKSESVYSQEYVSALLADNEYMRWRIKEMDLLFGKNLLAMRAAVIEAEHGEGHTAGMQWIFNTLFGPGELAPENETNAQDYYDREAEKIDVEFSKCMDFFDSLRKAKKEQA